MRHRRERTRLADCQCQGHSVAWDGNVEGLISKWDGSGPSEEPMLLALQDSKYGQRLRQQVLPVPRWDKCPNPLGYEEQRTEVKYAYDGAGLTSTYKYISRKDVEPTPTSLTAVASSKVHSETARGSTTTLKRKRTPTKVATEFEFVGDLDHDDTSPLSAKRRCVDSNATDGGVASKGEYRGGSGLVTKCHTTESQQNILHNKPTGTSNSSAPADSIPSEIVRHDRGHSKYRNAPSSFLNTFDMLPRDSSHTTPHRPHSEAHSKYGSNIGFVPQMIQPSITSTPKRGRPLTPELSGELKDRISAIFNTPLSAPAKLGWTETSGIEGGLRGEAPPVLDASQRSQDTGSRTGTPSGS